MLGVMKNIFSPDNWRAQREAIDFDKERLDRLQIGSAVEFGFMPQLALSAKRFKVTNLRTYAFNDDKFVSFALDHGLDHHVNMIVAESEGDKYLSISRHITEEEALKLFSAEHFDEVMEKFSGERIQCREGVVGFLGWTATSYRKVMEHVQGKVSEGDYREYPFSEDTTITKDFQYALFVSDTDEFAIEIERYQDDKVELYATIYRRAGDIARVFPPAKVFSQPEPDAELGKLDAKPNVFKIHPDADATPAIEAIQVAPETPAPVPFTIPVIRPLPEPAVNVEAPVLQVKEKQLIECDMRVAGKIIDEALQNKMKLSDLVRKILDLPLDVSESVHIPLALSDADYLTLASRYKLPVSDKEAIKRQIVQELSGFAGTKF